MKVLRERKTSPLGLCQTILCKSRYFTVVDSSTVAEGIAVVWRKVDSISISTLSSLFAAVGISLSLTSIRRWNIRDIEIFFSGLSYSTRLRWSIWVRSTIFVKMVWATCRLCEHSQFVVDLAMVTLALRSDGAEHAEWSHI